ncbi:putative acetyltransferase, GNAT superfamily [Streptoalloteichus tenebrarius]|uniref:Acetyltransferase, GNAT superfamily n=1 Tax=Streptoalloteichus tenebrarius (strain ATCC 17920 / DSM 40477 / JCM 4838 / CBS 697.72 / NBRC 16177 / NCIMB 11028 / NRRL B-12390 / A12253. 1 / ISP 5477) TaxID=1933 RepID=A0ABT1HWZ6_STRSD|nr:GNAT family N-acetyltransferase [Streptoalloteichus tenebrarius]MCP2260053.1 putative acetyltransferase, GNAT superfamily [Streptoalloteichus tenebrarius]BFF03826.1 hypothetical protein GCM10020241_55010 [Streptoalloteichus tenebrarius]
MTRAHAPVGGRRALETEAWRAAEAVASRAGLRLAELSDVDAQNAATALFRRIWRSEEDPPIGSALVRAIQFTGGYVAGAYLGGELVGAAVAFFAADGHLHSHITGVAPGHRGRHVGRALKLHQRAWALARGVTVIKWTFDPLVRRNAFFNIARLGALPTAYLVDFYGELTDALNAGAGSDRLVAEWRLDSPRAVAAAAGAWHEPDVDRLRETGCVRLDRTASGEPLPRADAWRAGRACLVAVPEDVEALRAVDGDLAWRWRVEVRAALREGMAQGWRVTGMARAGWYVVEADK